MSAVRGRCPLMLRTGWSVVRRTIMVSASGRSIARVVSETCTVTVWCWCRRPMATFCPATTITPVLDARRCTVIGSVDGRGGAPTGRARCRRAASPGCRGLGRVRSSSHRDVPAVEVAIIMRTSDGRFRHRRMGCARNDLESGLPFLFNRYPDMLAHGGRPRVERLVRDQDFDTFDEALRATQLQDRPADPDQWMLGGMGEQPLYPQPSLTGPDQPRNLRTAERLAVGLISVSVFALSLYAGFRFGPWLGSSTAGWAVRERGR